MALSKEDISQDCPTLSQTNSITETPKIQFQNEDLTPITMLQRGSLQEVRGFSVNDWNNAKIKEENLKEVRDAINYGLRGKDGKIKRYCLPRDYRLYLLDFVSVIVQHVDDQNEEINNLKTRLIQTQQVGNVEKDDEMGKIEKFKSLLAEKEKEINTLQDQLEKLRKNTFDDQELLKNKENQLRDWLTGKGTSSSSSTTSQSFFSEVLDELKDKTDSAGDIVDKEIRNVLEKMLVSIEQTEMHEKSIEKTTRDTTGLEKSHLPSDSDGSSETSRDELRTSDQERFITEDTHLDNLSESDDFTKDDVAWEEDISYIKRKIDKVKNRKYAFNIQERKILHEKIDGIQNIMSKYRRLDIIQKIRKRHSGVNEEITREKRQSECETQTIKNSATIAEIKTKKIKRFSLGIQVDTDFTMPLTLNTYTQTMNIDPDDSLYCSQHVERVLEKQTNDKPTYAQATKENITMHWPTQKSLFKPYPVFIQPRDSTKDVVTEVKTSLDPTAAGINIKSTKLLQNNKLLVLCNSKSDSKKLEDTINQNKNLQEHFEIRRPNKRQPAVKIIGVHNNYSRDDINNALFRKFGDNSKTLFPIKNNDKTDWVVRIPKIFYGQPKRFWNLQIGWDHYYYEEFYGIKQCNKCWDYGHITRECFNESWFCRKCAGNHHVSSCKSNEVVCTNCLIHNEKFATKFYTDHSPKYGGCAVKLMLIKKIRNSTDYSD